MGGQQITVMLVSDWHDTPRASLSLLEDDTPGVGCECDAMWREYAHTAAEHVSLTMQRQMAVADRDETPNWSRLCSRLGGDELRSARSSTLMRAAAQGKRKRIVRRSVLPRPREAHSPRQRRRWPVYEVRGTVFGAADVG